MSFNLRNQLNMLIQLAIADNQIAERERNMIYHVGQANGMSNKDIDELIRNPEPVGQLNTLSEDQKFEYLYNVVQLMKVDRKVFFSEILFCYRIAEQLGYKKGVIAEFSSKIYGDPSITTDKTNLKVKMRNYMKA